MAYLRGYLEMKTRGIINEKPEFIHIDHIELELEDGRNVLIDWSDISTDIELNQDSPSIVKSDLRDFDYEYAINSATDVSMDELNILLFNKVNSVEVSYYTEPEDIELDFVKLELHDESDNFITVSNIYNKIAIMDISYHEDMNDAQF